MVLEDLLGPRKYLLNEGKATVPLFREVELTYEKKKTVWVNEKKRKLTLDAEQFEELSFISSLFLKLADWDSDLLSLVYFLVVEAISLSTFFLLLILNTRNIHITLSRCFRRLLFRQQFVYMHLICHFIIIVLILSIQKSKLFYKTLLLFSLNRNATSLPSTFMAATTAMQGKWIRFIETSMLWFEAYQVFVVACPAVKTASSTNKRLSGFWFRTLRM